MERPSPKLPELRQDLRLIRGQPDERGRDRWLIYDPLAHRYHEIDRSGYLLLRHWLAGQPFEALAGAAGAELGRQIEVREISDFVLKLDQAGLLVTPLGGWRAAHQHQQAAKQGLLTRALHNYLFFRIPLIRPDRFLVKTLPIARVFGSRPFLIVFAILSCIGLLLASRQWDALVSTAMSSLTLEGAASYGAALVLVKICHEFGHAYTARHYGTRVPTMGVAFMVLTPMLYTDVSDAWSLASRRARIHIASAGILVELAIASLATLAWALLPEGPLRTSAYFLAVVSWVMSLTINISPLTRFDGYYILSDYWGIANLQTRGFALFRWKLRNVLFGLGARCPEDWAPARIRAVLVYAVVTAIYRLVLFTGIAITVYYMAFKILGIFLFLVEIIWFVLLPIWSELRLWWRMRGVLARHSRTYVTAGAFAAALIAGLIPWKTGIEVPAVLETVAAEHVTVPFPARVAHIHARSGAALKVGDPIVTLESPTLNQQIELETVRLAQVEGQLARIAGDATDREQRNVLEERRTALRNKLAGLAKQRALLEVKAGMDGVLVDMPSDLHVSRWVAMGESLGIIADRGQYHLRGYVPEPNVERIAKGAHGRFYPDELMVPSMPVTVEGIAPGAVTTLPLQELSATSGGPILVHEDRTQGSIPVIPQFPITMKLEGTGQGALPVVRGIVQIDGEGESYLARFAKRAAAVLIRELSF